MQRDTIEFVASLALGAVIGVAAATALRPKRLTRTERVLAEIRQRRHRVRTDVGRTRAALSESASAAKSVGLAVGEAGRDLANEVRGEVLGAAADAVERFALALADHLHHAGGRRRKANKRAHRIRP